ncbi:MAG: protein-glutamate O-methyltransferase CheR [Cyclobacteriaceae bacterium]|nr:protein-glutamate O-methyltransferase CheR [Cyclobacteriaceae bacterium]
MTSEELSDDDLGSIISLVRTRYGYDFSNYAHASFRRRVIRVMETSALRPNDLLTKFLLEPQYVDEFLTGVTVNVTEMFRDPGLWLFLRNSLLPEIRRQAQSFSVWHAGCSSGQEVLSMAILLRELEMDHLVQITATDIDTVILSQARAATYPAKQMEANVKNYQKAGGIGSLESYCTVEGRQVRFDQALLSRVAFRKHDLVSGGSFGKFDLIMCRNVLIYFNQKLQNQVVTDFHGSLNPGGFLAVGAKESLAWCDVANRFMVLDHDEKIFRKVRE